MASTAADNNSIALSPAADHVDIATMRGGATAGNSGGAPISPAAASQVNAGCVSCDGVTFTVTEGNKVAELTSGGARVLPSESFLDESTGTRYHFVDVHGDYAAAMLFLVSVQEDQRRIVDIKRFF